MDKRNYNKLNPTDLSHKLKQVLLEYPLISTFEYGVNGTYKAIDNEGNVYLVSWDFDPDTPIRSEQFVMNYQQLSRQALERNQLAPHEGWVLE